MSEDVVAIAALVGIGCGLDWLSSCRSASFPGFLVWGFTWPDYLAGGLTTFWYARGVRRSPRVGRPTWGRIVCFYLGIGLLFAVLQTGWLYFEEHMFFAHRIQHLVMHHLAPFFIALAWPGEALMRGMPGPLAVLLRRHVLRARSVRALLAITQQPVLAAFLFAGLVLLWVWPPVHLRAMLDARLFAVMNWSMILDGLLFFFLLFDPRPVTPGGLGLPARIVLALSVQVPQAATGGMIVFAPDDLYHWYDLCGRAYANIGALADQQLGGLLILFGGGMMAGISALILVVRLFRHEQASVAFAAPSL